MRVKEGQQDEYIQRHLQVWQEVLSDLKRAGVHKMSIFMFGLQLFLSWKMRPAKRMILLTLIQKVCPKFFTGKPIEE